MYRLNLGTKLMGPSEDRSEVYRGASELGYTSLVDFCKMTLVPEEGEPFRAQTQLKAKGGALDSPLVAMVTEVDTDGTKTYSLYECTTDEFKTSTSLEKGDAPA